MLYLVGNSIMIMSTEKGVFRSTDGGNTFTHLIVEPADSNAPCYGLVATNAATIYAGLSFRGVYKSFNGGFTWTKLPSGGPNGLPGTAGSTISLDASKSDPAIVYAAYTDTNNNQGGIYKSTDAGQTWFGGNSLPTYIDNKQGSHVNVIRVHPQDPDRVYAGGVSMLVTPTGGLVGLNSIEPITVTMISPTSSSSHRIQSRSSSAATAESSSRIPPRSPLTTQLRRP